jgi:hypothetical protein
MSGCARASGRGDARGKGRARACAIAHAAGACGLWCSVTMKASRASSRSNAGDECGESRVGNTRYRDGRSQCLSFSGHRIGQRHQVVGFERVNGLRWCAVLHGGSPSDGDDGVRTDTVRGTVEAPDKGARGRVMPIAGMTARGDRSLGTGRLDRWGGLRDNKPAGDRYRWRFGRPRAPTRGFSIYPSPEWR